MSNTTRTSVGVVGAGRWGTALAHAIASNGRDVLLYASDEKLVASINKKRANPELPQLAKLHKRVHALADPASLCDRCHLILIAVPVAQVREVARALANHLDGSHILVHAVRGLEPATFVPPSAILAAETCVRKIGALAGPVLVDELLAGRPNAAVVASRFAEVITLTRAALVSDNMRVYSNRDIIGVETAASMSRVIAIALGIALELNLGPATLSVLTTRGIAEVGRLCKALGGESTTAVGMAGLGDLLVLRESGGAELEVGRRLVRGESLETITAALGELDATDAANTYQSLALARGVKPRITAAVHAVLFAGLSVEDAVTQLMTEVQLND